MKYNNEVLSRPKGYIKRIVIKPNITTTTTQNGIFQLRLENLIMALIITLNLTSAAEPCLFA